MDKQRATPYDFNNQTYFLRLPTYLTGDEADQINNDGIDVYKEKEEDSEPTGFVLKVSGNQAGVKGNKEINIIVTGIAMQFLEMFRELKEIVFGSDMGNIFCKSFSILIFFSRPKSAILLFIHWCSFGSQC